MSKVHLADPLSSQSYSNLIQSFILGLNILRKNIVIYPLGHIAINHYADNLSTIMQEMFSHTPKFTINAIHRSLIINGELIDTKNANIQDFASFINRIGVASITLTKGLKSDDLVNFCQLALKIPQYTFISQNRDIQAEINAISKIEIREIDLSSVRFSDNEVAENIKTRAPLTIWQKLMLYSLSPDLLHTQERDLLKTIKILDQGSFENFIQTYDIPEDSLLQSYTSILNDHFQSASTQTDDLAIKQNFFRTIYANFSIISLPLKEKILAATFDTLNNIIEEKSQKEFLNCIPDEMVAEILTQAMIEKKEIAPLLIKLLGFLYKLGRHSNDKADGRDFFIDPVWKEIEELFNGEGYDKYLTKEYADQLDKLSLNSVNEHPNPLVYSSTDHLKSLEKANLNRHLVTALLLLMQNDIEDQLFSDFVETISYLLPEMVETGDYRDLCAVYKIFDKHLSDFKRPNASYALDAAIRNFSGENITTRLAEIYNNQGDQLQPELEELILLTGVNNLPWLIDQLLQQNNAAMIKKNLSIIYKFGGHASIIALRKLPGSDERQTIMLLQLIQHCKGVIPNSEINKLLLSKNIKVSCEAIKTLLHLNDDDALLAIWKMISSQDDHLFSSALKIIYDFELHELAVKLPQIIKTFYVTETVLERNKAILRLLGNLGIEEVIPSLKLIAAAKVTVTLRNLRLTKEYLFRTLAGYPKSSIGEIIEKGLRARNKQISITCRELLEMQQLSEDI